ncbi:MAG: hypothetical protein IKV21_01200, partial [Clostridia bacterium]|nr:hypothetical protein [Clostridia bacterium]
DSALHFLGAAMAVFFGYEIFCALMKRDRKEAPMTVVLLGAFCFSFLVTTCWELFEFSFDQIAGMMSGYPGDSQHWSFELALGTPKEVSIFNPIVPERWPIMDIMADMVLNTLGALLAFLYILFRPYRHKGKYSFDFDFAEKQTEVVNK